MVQGEIATYKCTVGAILLEGQGLGLWVGRKVFYIRILTTDVMIYADFPYFCVFITNLWREESSCLKGGQAYISQPQYDMEEENSPGQSIPNTNRKNPYQMTRS